MSGAFGPTMHQNDVNESQQGSEQRRTMVIYVSTTAVELKSSKR